MKALAVVVTHPIQYYVPVFCLLAKECKLKVFYTWGKNGIKAKHDPGFGKTIEWDLPLLNGYDYEILENTANEPGSHHRNGIINPILIEKLEEFKPNAILIYGWNYNSHWKAIRYFYRKVPIWFRGDSTLLNNERGLKAIAKKIYLKWVYSFVNEAFYVGANNRAYFKKYGLKSQNLIFAPHAIDNERFSEERIEEVDELKTKLGYTSDDIIILYAGKFEAVKNLNILIEAFNTLKAFPRAKLLLVGNGPDEAKLKAMAENNPGIKFLNFQNQSYLPTIYHACDIFCLPSISETWGLAINEAMAAGKAIVASDKVGCAIDLVKENVNGYIFPSNDQVVLMNKLFNLINQPHLIKSFGNQSRLLIKNWSFKNQVQQFIKMLNETN